MLPIAARSEKEPAYDAKDFWGLPLRSEKFVKHKEFDQVKKLFSRKAKTGAPVTIYGHAGMGKTQVALEYCMQRMRSDTFWFYADSIHTLYHCYHEFCCNKRLINRSKEDEKEKKTSITQDKIDRECIRNAIIDFLERELRSGKSCLIVYDNYHSKLAQMPFYEHLILVPNVDVIITSRTYSGTSHNVYVGGLSEEKRCMHDKPEASLLVRERIDDDISDAQISALTKRCNHNPLFLSRVAKMIASIAEQEKIPVKDFCTSWLEAKSVPPYIDVNNFVRAQLSFLKEKTSFTFSESYLDYFLSILQYLKSKTIPKCLLINWIYRDLINVDGNRYDRATLQQLAKNICDECIRQLVLCSLIKDHGTEIRFHHAMKHCLTVYFDKYSIEINISTALACIHFLTKKESSYSKASHWEEAYDAMLELLNDIQKKVREGLVFSEHANNLLYQLHFQQLNFLRKIIKYYFSLGFIDTTYDYLALAKQTIKANSATQEAGKKWAWVSRWQLLKTDMLRFEKMMKSDFPRVEDKKVAFVMGLYQSAENKSDVKRLTGSMGEPKLVKQIFSYLFKLPPSVKTIQEFSEDQNQDKPRP